MFQPGYTMHGFNWHDRRGVEGVGFVRALRTLLTRRLPSIMPDLHMLLSDCVQTKLADSPRVDGN
jgi:hypothetical protein